MSRRLPHYRLLAGKGGELIFFFEESCDYRAYLSLHFDSPGAS